MTRIGWSVVGLLSLAAGVFVGGAMLAIALLDAPTEYLTSDGWLDMPALVLFLCWAIPVALFFLVLSLAIGIVLRAIRWTITNRRTTRL